MAAGSRGVFLLLAAVLIGRSSGALAQAPLPTDPRLDTVRAELDRALFAADAAGAPRALLLSKIREGLAKGAPPERIRDVVVHMADRLNEAASLWRRSARGRETATTEMLRALGDARAVAVPPEVLASLIASTASAHAPTDVAVRATDALADLVRHGFSAERARAYVTLVLQRDPVALAQSAGAAEGLVTSRNLSPDEALEVLVRATAQTGSLAAAVNQAKGKPASSASASAPGNSGANSSSNAKAYGQSMGGGQGASSCKGMGKGCAKK